MVNTEQNQLCPYCRVVNTLCFWGERPYAKYKRPLLIFISGLMALGMVAFIVYFREQEGFLLLMWLISIFLPVMALLGVLVGFKGCNACVARMFGDF